MGAALVVAGGVVLCGGPLLIVPVVLTLMGVFVGADSGVLQLVIAVIAAQLSALLAVSLLYRWCFGRAPVRGAGVLAASVVFVLLVSDAAYTALLGTMLSKPAQGISLAQFYATLAVESFTAVGLTCVVCTLVVLLIELPLRWVQGEWAIVSEGAFRAIRALLLLLMILIASASIREEGVSQMVAVLRSALG